MTAATITRTASHADTIAEAQAVFTAARAAEWPDSARPALGDAGEGLAVALRDYHRLCNGIVPPWFPGMRPGPEGKAAALRLAADRAWEAAEVVAALLDEHFGNEGGKAA